MIVTSSTSAIWEDLFPQGTLTFKSPLHKLHTFRICHTFTKRKPQLHNCLLYTSTQTQSTIWKYYTCLLYTSFDTSPANKQLLGLQGVTQNTINIDPLAYKENCHKLYYLMKRHQYLCALSENIFTVAGTGAKMSVEECQYQFQMNRQNCTTSANTTSVFGEILSIKSHEQPLLIPYHQLALCMP